jgi:hypothetical protein
VSVAIPAIRSDVYVVIRKLLTPPHFFPFAECFKRLKIQLIAGYGLQRRPSDNSIKRSGNVVAESMAVIDGIGGGRST